MSISTLVLGIGNTLLSDEGVGVRVIERLQAMPVQKAGVEYLDGGTMSFELAPLVEQSERLIVIDAAQIQAPPGTVRCFVDDEMDRFVRGSRRTAHEIGLSDIMDMVRLQGNTPRRRALVAVQFCRVSLGETLTESVAEALPQVADTVNALIAAWDQADA